MDLHEVHRRVFIGRLDPGVGRLAISAHRRGDHHAGQLALRPDVVAPPDLPGLQLHRPQERPAGTAGGVVGAQQPLRRQQRPGRRLAGNRVGPDTGRQRLLRQHRRHHRGAAAHRAQKLVDLVDRRPGLRRVHAAEVAQSRQAGLVARQRDVAERADLRRGAGSIPHPDVIQLAVEGSHRAEGASDHQQALRRLQRRHLEHVRSGDSVLVERHVVLVEHHRHVMPRPVGHRPGISGPVRDAVPGEAKRVVPGIGELRREITQLLHGHQRLAGRGHPSSGRHLHPALQGGGAAVDPGGRQQVDAVLPRPAEPQRTRRNRQVGSDDLARGDRAGRAAHLVDDLLGGSIERRSRGQAGLGQRQRRPAPRGDLPGGARHRPHAHVIDLAGEAGRRAEPRTQLQGPGRLLRRPGRQLVRGGHPVLVESERATVEHHRDVMPLPVGDRRGVRRRPPRRAPAGIPVHRDLVSAHADPRRRPRRAAAEHNCLIGLGGRADPGLERRRVGGHRLRPAPTDVAPPAGSREGQHRARNRRTAQLPSQHPTRRVLPPLPVTFRRCLASRKPRNCAHVHSHDSH